MKILEPVTQIPDSALSDAAGNTQEVTSIRMVGFVLLLICVNLIWAGQPTAIKYIPSNQLGPFAIAFLPLIFATLILLPLLWKQKTGNHVARPTTQDWMRFTIAGVFGQLVAQLGMTWGAIVGQASSCAILYLLIPIITAVLASCLLKERISALRILCLAIGFAGVLLMSASDLGHVSLLTSKYMIGNMLFLGGCLGASFYNVYCKGLMKKFHERDILIYSYFASTPASLAILLWKEPQCFRNLAYLDTSAWIALAFLTFLVYGLSMLMFFYVLQYLPVTVVLASTYLVPVFGVVIAMALLDEQLSLLTMVGATIVLVATVLILWFEPTPTSTATLQVTVDNRSPA